MKKTIGLLILAALASASVAEPSAPEEANDAPEKCYGIAKAEKNDCSSKDGSHSCAGYATKDRDKNTWIYLPKGVCDKIAGGEKG
jgi:uncharacterized membrane protein